MGVHGGAGARQRNRLWLRLAFQGYSGGPVGGGTGRAPAGWGPLPAPDSSTALQHPTGAEWRHGGMAGGRWWVCGCGLAVADARRDQARHAPAAATSTFIHGPRGREGMDPSFLRTPAWPGLPCLNTFARPDPRGHGFSLQVKQPATRRRHHGGFILAPRWHA